MRFRVFARPRIHIGLVDLAGVSARSFCGVGFSVCGPQTIWRIDESSAISLTGISHLDGPALGDLNRIVADLSARSEGGFSATLESNPPQHTGFGTKTSLLLSLIVAIDRIKRFNLPKTEIQRISGRGGTSGVGINLFFHGGVLWDGGHAAVASQTFLPSSSSLAADPPPMLARWHFPEQWRVGLLVPDTTNLSGAEELAFFKRQTPLGDNDVLRTMSAIYHGVIPAFATNDLSLLRSSLKKIHSVGFKHSELLAQSKHTRDVFDKLESLPGVAAGLSSLGPLLYCLFDAQDEESQRSLEQISQETGSQYLGVFRGNNEGFRVESI